MPTTRRHPRPLLSFLLALALLVPALASAPPARADACTVTTGDGTGAGSLPALLAARLCPLITFDPGVTVVNLDTRPQITYDVTIRGTGAASLALQYSHPDTPDEEHGSVAWVRAGTVRFENLTIRGGRTVSNRGAGLIIDGSLGTTSVTLDHVTLTDNIVSNGGGGGLYVRQATLAIVNSIVSGNKAQGTSASTTKNGGGLYIDDAGGDAIVTVTDSVISGNQATVSGGGIYLAHVVGSSKAQLMLTSSTVSGNQAATFRGGGIANDGGTLTASKSTLSGNTASSGGGLANLQSTGTLTLINSTVSGNQTTAGGGGGLYNTGTATLTAVTLVDNHVAPNVVGGGFYTGSDGLHPPSFHLSRSIVAGNFAGTSASNCGSDPSTPPKSDGDNLVGTAGCFSNGTGDLTLSTPLNTALDPTLADNGGPTKTHNLVPGGLATDQIPPDRCATTATDQRDVPRPQDDPAAPGSGCDIGAVEYQPPAPSPSPSSTPACGARFGDVRASDPACVAIEALAARGVIKGCDQTAVPPLFCPDQLTLRAQMAALIVRAMGWSGETPDNPFSDKCDPLNPANCVDDELWNAVGVLGAKGVAKGYLDAPTCAPANAPCYAARDNVLYAQTISFITRAMVKQGYWAAATSDNSAIYPNIPDSSGHRLDFVTYVANVGPVPGTASATQNFDAWDQASTRAWFAQALWQALQGH